MVQAGEVFKVCAGQEGVRLLFRLRTGSGGLLEDKRCRMIQLGCWRMRDVE